MIKRFHVFLMVIKSCLFNSAVGFTFKSTIILFLSLHLYSGFRCKTIIYTIFISYNFAVGLLGPTITVDSRSCLPHLCRLVSLLPLTWLSALFRDCRLVAFSRISIAYITLHSLTSKSSPTRLFKFMHLSTNISLFYYLQTPL